MPARRRPDGAAVKARGEFKGLGQGMRGCGHFKEPDPRRWFELKAVPLSYRPSVPGLDFHNRSPWPSIRAGLAPTARPDDPRNTEGDPMNRMTNSLDFQAQALTLRAERQRIIAGNIANADTPGYVARDMDFASALREATGTQAAGSTMTGATATAR